MSVDSSRVNIIVMIEVVCERTIGGQHEWKERDDSSLEVDQLMSIAVGSLINSHQSLISS